MSYCPFIKGPCKTADCDLFQSLPIMAPGELVGMVKQGTMTGCSIVLNAFLMAQLMNILAAGSGPKRSRPN